MNKQTYKIEGMSCNGCKAHVETLIRSVAGVGTVLVDLPGAEAVIESDAPVSFEKLRDAFAQDGGNYAIVSNDPVTGNGSNSNKCKTSSKKILPGNGIYYCPMHCEGEKTYNTAGSCPVCGMDLVEQPSSNIGSEEVDKSYTDLLFKFKIAVGFTLPVFLIAMTEMWVQNPLFQWMELKYWNIVQMILSVPVVFYAAWMFYERAWRSIITWHLNMFTLIGIGSGIAWLFSVGALFFPGLFPNEFKTHHGTVYVYFEAATVILTLVLLGQLLEARAHGKTNKAIKELLKLAPSKATKISNGEEMIVPIDTIVAGDLLRVKPGEKIPVDGVITSGEGVIDESMITGEPIPIEKATGDKITAGTINSNKSFVMRAEKVGAETLLSKIIEMVNAAARSRAPIQKLADKISGYFVPLVVGVSGITFLLWAVYGPEPSYVFALVNAIAVLIIACPCALGLATPMSVMVGVGRGAQSGVLIKNAAALEQLNKIQVLIVDKTGTLTEGKPLVQVIHNTSAEYTESEVITMIVSLNNQSEHPLAQAAMQFGKLRGISAQAITSFESHSGKGVTGVLNGSLLALGNERLMHDRKAIISPEIKSLVYGEQKKGKTVSYLAEGTVVIGYMVISDTIKPSAKDAVQRLQQKGIQVIMFTGDNEDAARTVSEALQLNGFKSQMLPQDKLLEIKKLQHQSQLVVMAGDGSNDAPALAQANIGIAMGTGTDIAIESASITLVKGDLAGIEKAINLSSGVMRNIKQNLFFALGYNILGIPIAAGVLYPFTGVLLSPMIAALAMSLSSVSVIGNALRLRNIKL